MADVPANSYPEVQAVLARGWNTWDTRSVLTQVLLPHGLAVSLGLKEYYTGNTLSHVQIGRHGENDERVVLGPHAIDGSYSAVDVTWRGIEFRVQTAHDGEDLVVLVEPVVLQQTPPTVTVSFAFLWNRPGTVAAIDSTLVAVAEGLETTLFATVPGIDDRYLDVDGPVLALRLDDAIGVCTGHPRAIDEIERVIAAAARANDPEPGAVETEHAVIVRDSIAWNTIYEPSGRRVIATVSRLWNVGKRGGYVMFCWDAFLNALLAGVSSRDLAYANAIEMLRELTPDGFVPNVAQGTGRVTLDGSQPPLGSLVCRELYRRFGDAWFLQEVFPALLSWNRWWWRARRSGPLLCLGSTVFVPSVPSPQDIPRIGKHFGATCESGCDDHPVFADIPFDDDTGLLRAWDVGLNSEYVLDCEALADIAGVMGDLAARDELLARATSVSDAIRERLWHDESGIYRNIRTDSREPTESVAPLNLLPMLAGVSGTDQSATMVSRYLRDEEWFGGEWPIPSTPRNDPRTARQSYWSGRAWPPINFLVYLGLRRAGQWEAATWLAAGSDHLVLGEWREHRHVHENYSSVTGEGCDVTNSEPFYSWGALLSLTVLIERGVVDYFAEWPS